VDKPKFSVEAILSCDDRGSLILPKDIRKKLKIGAGEKLALLNIVSDDDEFFLTLIRVNSLESLIKKFMTPVMKEVIK
jgi:bifunctional DNA-binding transcriptional regulator/antitoxin component of YhaV-PrlF toxin-antitoxin module